MKKLLLSYLFSIVLFSSYAFPQNESLLINLDDEGQTFIKASLMTQFWVRYTELNPGSTIYGEDADSYFDISARRLRVNIKAQLTPDIYIYSTFGGNNLNYQTSDSFSFKVLDLYAEYSIADEFEIGVGKSGWQGLTRYDVRSSSTLLTLDAPLVTLNSVNRNDDTARNLGLWLKGKLSALDYRFVLNNPLAFDSNAPGTHSDFANTMPRLKTSGYVKFQFFDKESNKSGYSKGTYLGEKKFFNVGIGFMHQPKAMWSSPNGSDTLFHNMTHFAVDFFFDSPVNHSKGTAITSFLGLYKLNYGPDYIRNVGANNAANGISQNASFNGSGNAFPMMGTGTTAFFQLGYLFREGFISRRSDKIQPNISIQYSEFERLNDPVLVYDFSINYYINSHFNKLTLGLQNRPVFFTEGIAITQKERRNMIVLQYQVIIN